MRALLISMLAAGLVWPASGQAQSPRQAFWRSLLVPGWGQHYAGRSTSAARFLAVEASLWGGYAGFRWLAAVRRDNYRSYAAVHAGARPAGQDNQYFDDLGFYASTVQHNQYAAYEDGPDAVLYPPDAAHFWEWDSDASRRQYKELRNAGERAERNALYVSGALIVHHLISAVHAARVAGRPGMAASSPPVDARIDPRQGRVSVSWVRAF